MDRPTGSGDDKGLEELSDLGAAPTTAVAPEPRRRRRERTTQPRARSRRGVIAVVLVVAALALVPAVASGLNKTPRDKVGISYGGGPIEGTHYQRTIAPGSSLFWNGFLDSLYLYPADQQNYIISKQPGVDGSTADFVTAPSRDRVQVTFEVAVYFKLDTDRLRAFHEQFGLKYEAYTGAGWDALLQDTFRQQIENALQEETRRSAVADLYGDADLLIAIQERVQTTLSRRLKDAMGDQFFCSPTFTPGSRCEDPIFIVKAIRVPDNVAKAYESNRTSEVQIQTKLNEVAQRKAEAAGITALSEALAAAGDNYVLLKAIESGKVNFWVIPDGTGLDLTTPEGATPGGQSTTTTTTTTADGQ